MTKSVKTPMDASHPVARHQIIQWERYARKIAATAIARHGMHHLSDDAQSAALEGLVSAAIRYDPDKGGFPTYAKFWIRQTVDRMVDSHRSVVKCPYSSSEKIAARKAILEIENATGRKPTDE